MQVPDPPAPIHPAPEWTFAQKCRLLLWEWCWSLLAVWTPKPFNPWRLLLLKSFGADIGSRPFVHPRSRIQVPWNLTLGDKACIGSRADLYSLDKITIGAHSIIAQESYLCTGTHQREGTEFPLYTAPITVGEKTFIGARAFILPGISVGDGCTLGAGSTLTKTMGDGETWAGNPARPLTRTED